MQLTTYLLYICSVSALLFTLIIVIFTLRKKKRSADGGVTPTGTEMNKPEKGKIKKKKTPRPPKVIKHRVKNNRKHTRGRHIQIVFLKETDRTKKIIHFLR